MMVYRLSRAHSSHFGENGTIRVLKILSFSFINLQFIENNTHHAIFNMRDTEYRSMNDYLDDSDSAEWRDDVTIFIADWTEWSTLDEQTVAINHLVNNEFIDSYNSMVNSTLLITDGGIIRGMPPSKRGNNTVTVINHIFFKMGIICAQTKPKR